MPYYYRVLVGTSQDGAKVTCIDSIFMSPLTVFQRLVSEVNQRVCFQPCAQSQDGRKGEIHCAVALFAIDPLSLVLKARTAYKGRSCGWCLRTPTLTPIGVTFSFLAIDP